MVPKVRDLYLYMQTARTVAEKLPTLLEGAALAEWTELTEEEKKDLVMRRRARLIKLSPTGMVIHMFT